MSKRKSTGVVIDVAMRVQVDVTGPSRLVLRTKNPDRLSDNLLLSDHEITFRYAAKNEVADWLEGLAKQIRSLKL
jgi:hypothetical protein